MSLHSYSRCWIHLIWGTLSRERVLNKKAAAELSRYLAEYADEQGVYMKTNFVDSDHMHGLIDLPTGFSIEKLVQLLKGSSSHWVNSNDVITGKFAWGRGCFLGVAFKCRLGSAIHCGSGGTSSYAHVHRRIARVHRSSRTALAR